MSTATAEASAHDAEHDDHPSDAKYWKIGAILGLITLAEVSTYFITDDPYSHDLAPLLIGSLLVMMVAKFATIGAYFMHLKFDNRVFKVVFVSGLVLAVGVYIVMISTFAFWDDGYESGHALLSAV